MLMHSRIYPTIFYVLDYSSISTFHRQSRYGAKNLLFSAVEAVVYTWQNAVRRLSASIHTAPNVLASEWFLTLLNVLKQLIHQLVMFFQVLLAPEICLHRVFPPILCIQIFWCARTFFIIKFKIIVFEASKPFSACRIRQSIVTISLNKNSMCFSCRFVLNKVVQYTLLFHHMQIHFTWHKSRYFQNY